MSFKFNHENTDNLPKQLFLTDVENSKGISKSAAAKNPIDENRTPGADVLNDNTYATYINNGKLRANTSNDVINNNYANLESYGF